MSRLVLFLFGVVVGAAGVFALYNRGILELAPRAAPSVQAGPTAEDQSVLQPPIAPPEQVATPAPMPSTPIEPAPVSVDPLAPAPQPADAGDAPIPVLAGPSLLIPVQGIRADQLVDTYTQARGLSRLHDAIDIMAPRGTPVLAVADGRVVKLFDSKRGGLTLYQFDAQERLAYYYAHLDRYANGVAEGKLLKRGDVLGYVGITGNSDPAGPHLHFAVSVLGPEKNWWQGTAVNPFPLLVPESGSAGATPPSLN